MFIETRVQKKLLLKFLESPMKNPPEITGKKGGG